VIYVASIQRLESEVAGKVAKMRVQDIIIKVAQAEEVKR